MELDDPPDPLRARREEGGTEMQRALLLPEPGPRNNADTRGVQEAETPELVREAVFLLGLLDGLGRDVDGWEEVHRALFGGESVSGVGFEEMERVVEGGLPEGLGIRHLPFP